MRNPIWPRTMVCVEYLCENSFTTDCPDEIRGWMFGILVDSNESGVTIVTKIAADGTERERVTIPSARVIGIN